MSKMIHEVFGFRTPKPVPVEAVCPLGEGSNVCLDPNYVFDEIAVKRSLGNIALQQPIWAWGPSGCGKTEFFLQIGARLNRPVFVLSIGEETSLRELLGTFQLRQGEGGTETHFTDGALTRAIRTKSALVLLDEFNMAPPGVAAQLNRLLEAREITIPETGELVKMAPQSVLVATANTSGGMDASGNYAGSQIQNAATRNRFVGLKLSYPEPEREMEIIRKRFSGLDAQILFDDPVGTMVRVANAVRALVDSGSVGLAFSLRTQFQWAIKSISLKSFWLGFLDAYYDLLDPAEAVPVNEVFHRITGLDAETGQPRTEAS